ncbi:hypothetical protein NDU88_003133 [Pleurodeles waltl]|uniref:Uncharacterized protein n=1 Tax=Pleurodeles waltl TaxID=8319 RepID=A0AAV7SCK5_PLEWA|nr:hypothetical protein NDU88_003133 [Pleurodeles waltl]
MSSVKSGVRALETLPVHVGSVLREDNAYVFKLFSSSLHTAEGEYSVHTFFVDTHTIVKVFSGYTAVCTRFISDTHTVG